MGRLVPIPALSALPTNSCSQEVAKGAHQNGIRWKACHCLTAAGCRPARAVISESKLGRAEHSGICSGGTRRCTADVHYWEETKPQNTKPMKVETFF